MSDTPIILSTRGPSDRASTILALIDGEEFRFRRQKVYSLFESMKSQEGGPGRAEMATYERVKDWLFDGLVDGEQAKRLQERLEDANDAFDVPHLMELFRSLMEQMTGRPTPSPRG
jgi:hypothetical protein